MTNLNLLIVVLSLALASTVAVDYCSKDLKCQRTPHVACNNSLFKGGWGGKCHDPELIEMTDEMKAALLDMHNKFRNQQANGDTPNYEPATRMATMRWDDTLAKFAETNVRSCQYGHDPCHNTMSWSIAGQNAARSRKIGYFQEKPAVETVVAMASRWFTEEHGHGKLYGGMKFINKYGLPKIRDPTKHVGHFTQVVTDDAFAIGCAASKFKDGKRLETFVICDYSRGNLNGSPVYVAGPTASGCKTGTNSKYPGLCSETEKYEGWYYA